MKPEKKQSPLLSPVNEASYITQRVAVIDDCMKQVCTMLPPHKAEYEAYQTNSAAKRYIEFKDSLKNKSISKVKFNALVNEYETLYNYQSNPTKRDPRITYTILFQLEILITLFGLYAALWEKYEADGNASQAKAMFIKLAETFGSIERTTLEKLNSNIRSGHATKIAHQGVKAKRILSGLKGQKGRAQKIDANWIFAKGKYDALSLTQKSKYDIDVARHLCKHHPEIQFKAVSVSRKISMWKKLS